MFESQEFIARGADVAHDRGHETRARCAPGGVPDPGRARSRRHGDRLSRLPADTRARGCAQGAARLSRRAARLQGPLSPRGCRGRAPAASQHPFRLRPRRAGRGHVHRQRVRRGRLTQTGAMVGTPTYMAPEQCAGQEAGPPADIYALGVIAFEMITGRVPFNAPTPLGVIAAHQMTPPPSPRKLNPSLPESVVLPILTCLAKDPRQRQETATEFIEQLAIAVAASASQYPLTPPPMTQQTPPPSGMQPPMTPSPSYPATPTYVAPMTPASLSAPAPPASTPAPATPYPAYTAPAPDYTPPP